MYAHRLPAPVVALMAILFVLLVLYLNPGPSPVAQGTPLGFYHVTAEELAPHGCNYLESYLRLDADRKIWAYSNEISRSELVPVVRSMMEYRSPRLLYASVDPSLPYGEAMEFFSQIRGALPEMRVMLVAGAIRQYEQYRPVPCGVNPYTSIRTTPPEGLLVWISVPPDLQPPARESFTMRRVEARRIR
jgi:biopolymer transport protein ExbD